MSKMKVQDATKELSRRAAKLLGDVTGVRTAAEKTLAELRKIENGFTQQQEAEREEKRREEQQKALSSQSKAWTMPDDVPVEKAEEKAPEAPKADDGYVTIDEFFKTQLIAAKILACEKVEKSDKLLKSTLDIGGGETRTVVSGIAKWYNPEDMPGRTGVLVKNLPPRKMMGQESCGMLLSAERGDKLNLVMLDDKVPAGSRLV